MDQIKRLDQSGQLAQVMPGLKDFAQKNAPSAAAAPKAASQGAPQ
jgi:hypothetical protein